MRRHVIAAAIGFLLGSFNLAHAGDIVLGHDPGGEIDDYQRFFRYIEASKVHVRIHAACVSACTLVLGLPKDQVCVEPRGQLGFHLVTVTGPHGEDKPDKAETLFMIHANYPKPVQDWIMKNHWPLTKDIVFMDSDTIKALGVFDACKDEDK